MISDSTDLSLNIKYRKIDLFFPTDLEIVSRFMYRNIWLVKINTDQQLNCDEEIQGKICLHKILKIRIKSLKRKQLHLTY